MPSHPRTRMQDVNPASRERRNVPEILWRESAEAGHRRLRPLPRAVRPTRAERPATTAGERPNGRIVPQAGVEGGTRERTPKSPEGSIPRGANPTTERPERAKEPQRAEHPDAAAMERGGNKAAPPVNGP